MNFVNLLGNGWSPPSDRQVAEFFRIVQERPRRRIFVHWVGTEAGCLLLYTGLHSIDGRQTAIQEMHAYHFKAFLHPNLTAYVRSFPQRLARSSSLASFRHLASQERKTPIR